MSQERDDGSPDDLREMRSGEIVELLKTAPVATYPLCLALLLFPTDAALPVAYDLLYYMTFAVQINLGNGYAMLNGVSVLWRGPIFPLLLAGSFRLFGTSIESAFIVLRFFLLANVSVAFLIGRSFRDKWTGLLAGLLVAASSAVTHWSLRHIDHIVAFWLFSAVYTIHKTIISQEIRWPVLTGIALGLGYLTKETALLFIPLPALVLLFIRPNRRFAIKKLGITYTVLLLTVTPWFLYLSLGGHSQGALGHRRSLIFDVLFPNTLLSFSGLLTFISHTLWGVIGFTTTNLSVVGFGGIVVLSWIYLAYRAIHDQDDAPILLCTAGGLTIPVLVFVYYANYQPRHTLIIYLVSLIVVATATRDGVEWSNEMLPFTSNTRTSILTAVVAILLITQLSVGLISSPAGLDPTDSMVIHGVTGTPTNASGAPKALFTWLNQRTNSNESVMFSTGRLGRQGFVEFQGDPDIVYTPMGIFRLSSGELICYLTCNTPNQRLSGHNTTMADDDIIYLTTSTATPKNMVGGQVLVYAISEQKFLQELKSQNVQYTVLSNWRWQGVEKYYEANPAITHQATIEGYKIYRVDNPTSIDVDPIVTSQASDFYTTTKTDFHEEHQQYKFVIKERLSLNATEVHEN